MSNFVPNFWTQFENSGSIKKKPGKIIQEAPPRSLIVLYSKRSQECDKIWFLSWLLSCYKQWKFKNYCLQKPRWQRTVCYNTSCVQLISSHKKIRLAWCRDHRHWTRNQWGTILLADESLLSLNINSPRTFILWKIGIRYLFSNFWRKDNCTTLVDSLEKCLFLDIC